MFFHRFQQARLGARRGAVDFVRQHQLGKQRARTELEFPFSLIVELNADQIGRHQIRCKLDPLEREIQRLGDRFGQRRLSGAGYVF